MDKTETSNPEYSEFYRHTTVGTALINSLTSMIKNEEITEEEAAVVFRDFERTFISRMREATANNLIDSIQVQAKLTSYNNSTQHWRIDAENADVNVGSKSVNVSLLRLIFESDISS
mmetsp:Transcript_1142/g.1849  ORF Transcript_1142/g.1849 Transcript_1142/m.1849 type:complete len:117 (+) Transcript_1142:231-581(+)